MKWNDHPDNPLILPHSTLFYNIIGDPTVLNPDETPDCKWHLWANSIPGLHHYISDNGIKWIEEPKNRSMKNFRWGIRCVILKRVNTFYLYYEKVRWIGKKNVIMVTQSTDLYTWSKPKLVLKQNLEWEKQNRLVNTIACPGIAYHPELHKYFLFYSTGMVPLKGENVKGIMEPINIGLAISEAPDGPFIKLPKPIISPHPDDQWHNLGAGAMQIYYIKELQIFLGLNNGIYRRKTDTGLVDGSAIMLYTSKDGKTWTLRTEEPILQPNESGRMLWKDALVYQMGLTLYQDTYYLYYNARNKEGKEYIGLATCPKQEVYNFLT